MRILTVVCAAVLCGCAAKSPFAIRIAPDAQPATRRAAAELQHYVREATGRTLAITNDLNGRGFAYLPTNADYGPDGYRIVSDGERLEIRANGIHGHLFGTYGFLKRFLGVQWFLASYTNIPRRAAFDLPAGLDWTDVPAFELRDLCEPTTTRDLDFALHLRLHGRHFRVPYPESVGGESFTMDKVLQNSHTFQRILPPSRHFREHPEWYSEVDGKRREVGGQLCLSNPEVLRRTIDFVLGRMRQNPKVKYFGVSQNDVRNFCTCAKCRAVDEEEGAHSGSIIRFVNKVAEAVEKVDPEVTVTTLAYQYSVEPPKHVRPRRNVMIVLCDIGCDFSKPFGTSRAKPNVEFTRILEGWKALGARIYMWDYTTNYPYYQELFHNVDTLGPNLRFFRDHGVRQVYEEGANFAPHADSSELKTWMLSELMWNPDQDTDALRDTFIDGVYGKGAPFVKDYYRLRRELARTRDEVAHPMTCFEDIVNGPATLAFFERAEALWMKALEAAKGDAVAERQCRLGLFSTDAAHAILATRTPSGANFVITRHPETLGGPEILRAQEAAKRVLGFLKAEPRQRLAHGSSPVDDIVLRRQVQLFAERKFDVSGAGSFEAGPRSMKVDSVAEYYKHVPDAEALDGEIVEMNTEYSMQGIKFFFKNAFVEPGCGVRCRLRMRIRKLKGGDPEQVIAFGAIDAPGCTDGRVTRSFRIRAKDVGTDGWAWYDIGTVPMVDSKSRVWLGIAGTHEKPVAEYIALDRLEVSLASPASPGYADLRAELKAFYPPGYCRRECQSKEQVESCAAIGRELDAWAAAHPDYDALDVRRESYLAMRRHFVPFVFTNSPFYFEAGVNGGWSGARPARHVNRICRRFYKEHNLVPDEAFRLQRARTSQNLTLCCGPFVDDMHHVPPMRTILEKGFKGVREDVAAALAACPEDDPHGRKQLETALVGLDTIHEIQLAFAKEAERRLAESNNLPIDQSNNLRRIAEAANRCPWEPPRTFYEGLNTLWFVREIVGYVDGVNIFALGRPDAWFIDFYRREIAAGTLTEAEARDLVSRFLIIADCHEADSTPLDSYDDQEAEIPLTLGGCDENGESVYNELTRMFLDAHLACDCVYPKLHVRVGTNSPKAYLEHLGAQLCKGHAVFTVFNDDRLVKQFVDEGFDPKDARNYIGCGCWNGYVDSMQDVDGANYVSLIKLLALTIHRDPEAERACALVLDPIDDVKSFEELRDTVYRNYMRFFKSLMSEYTRYGRSSAKVFPHPAYTACMRGGIASRRDTTDGGLTGRQRPREITLGFVGNVVDSLCAIDQVCFRDRVCTVREFLDAVRANWKGERNAKLRQRALDAPYWGDNSDRSTSLMAWFMRKTHEDVDGLTTDQGGKYRLAIFTYREFMYWGAKTKATPDGRYDGDRLAQGFSPSEFRCKEGMTAVMNAIGRLPNECLYECNANLTFDASAMTPELMGAVLAVFAEKGSHLMQPNCNSVEQLLEAQRHPELHRDLIVRVCGFSARFTSLSKRWQDEVIARHRLK